MRLSISEYEEFGFFKYTHIRTPMTREHNTKNNNNTHTHTQTTTQMNKGDEDKKGEKKTSSSRWSGLFSISKFKAKLPPMDRYTLRDAALFVVSAAVIVKFGDLVAV